jgi:hypothetical protein
MKQEKPSAAIRLNKREQNVLIHLLKTRLREKVIKPFESALLWRILKCSAESARMDEVRLRAEVKRTMRKQPVAPAVATPAIY